MIYVGCVLFIGIYIGFLFIILGMKSFKLWVVGFICLFLGMFSVVYIFFGRMLEGFCYCYFLWVLNFFKVFEFIFKIDKAIWKLFLGFKNLGIRRVKRG